MPPEFTDQLIEKLNSESVLVNLIWFVFFLAAAVMVAMVLLI